MWCTCSFRAGRCDNYLQHNKIINVSIAFPFWIWYYISMNDNELIQQLKAELAMAKQTLQANSKLLKEYKATIDKQNEKLEAYKELASAALENYGLKKISDFVSKSEKLSSFQISKILKDLNATKVSEDTNDDISETAKYIASKKEPKDLEKYSSEDARPSKKAGHQPGVKTCGRNVKDMALLDKIDHTDDLMKDCAYSDEFKSSLKLLKVTDRNRLVYVRGFLKNMIVHTYYYVDGNGTVYKSNSSLAPDLVRGGKISNSVIASVVVDKVIWASPLNAQAKRINLVSNAEVVNAQLLSRSFIAASDAITPIWETLLNYIKSQQAIHGDESRLLVVRNEDKKRAALGQMWALSYSGKNSPACYYKFYSNRRKECAKELYDGCKGVAIQTDGYSAYGSVIKDLNSIYLKEIKSSEGEAGASEFANDYELLAKEGILLVGCMAHGRRKLVKAMQLYNNKEECECVRTCNDSLKAIQEIYRIEKDLRAEYDAKTISESEFIEKRKSLVEPLLETLKSQADAFLSSKLAKAAPTLREAYVYLKNQLKTISNYLYCSELTPDNNFQERQFRPLAAARRACLFATSEDGAAAWGKLLSICQTAVLNKLDPTIYLKYLLDEVATMYRDDVLESSVDWSKYLPWNVDREMLKTVWDK